MRVLFALLTISLLAVGTMAEEPAEVPLYFAVGIPAGASMTIDGDNSDWDWVDPSFEVTIDDMTTLTGEWDDADDFFDSSVDGLFDHGRDEYIVSVHYVKTLLAAREEIRSGAAGAATDTVLASLNRLVNSPLTLKHVRRTAHQAMEFVILDG